MVIEWKHIQRLALKCIKLSVDFIMEKRDYVLACRGMSRGGTQCVEK